MAEESSLSMDYKNLHDLRVVDLKKELEKRGLSKSGSKKELVERLKTQLKIEELREKSKSGAEGVQAPSIQLSEGGQNEIVKNYLQQREKLFEQQMEQKKKYQEEASRSQESESQSETDDGQSSQPKLEDTPQKLHVEHEKPRGKELEKLKEEETVEEETGSKEEGTKYKSNTDQEEQHGRDESLNKSVQSEQYRRSRSRSGSARSSSSSRSRERSRSGSRPKDEHKTAETSAKTTKRVPSRSPSVEEVHSGSSSPERRSAKTKDPPKNRPVSSEQSLPSKRMQRSRSRSSSSDSASDRRNKSQKKQSSKKGAAAQSSDSESTEEERGSRSTSTDSSDSSPPRKHLPSGGHSDEDSKQKRKSKSASRSVSSSDTDEVIIPESGFGKMASSRSPSPNSGDNQTSELKMDTVVETVITLMAPEMDIDRTEDEFRQKPTESSANGKTDRRVESSTVSEQVTHSRSQMDNAWTTASLPDAKADEPEIKPTRKRRWGSTTLKTITSQPSVNISTESLKALIPEMKVDLVLTETLPELDNPSPEPHNHQDESLTRTVEADDGRTEEQMEEETKEEKIEVPAKRKVVYKSQESMKQKEAIKMTRTVFQTVKPDDETKDSELDKSFEAMDTVEVQTAAEGLDDFSDMKSTEGRKMSTEQEKKVDATKPTRRPSRLQVPLIPVDDPQPVDGGRRSPSPARNLATNIVHIHHLVRPYTLGQLKELLSQTGTVAEDGFWIDKIKSHCLVIYSSVDEAIATRRLLHRKRWPSSNPNILRVEYSNQEEFDMFKNAKDGVLPIKPIVKPEEPREKRKDEKVRPPDHSKEPERKEPPKPAARDGRPRAKERTPPVREWDRDKIRQSRSRSRNRTRREEKPTDRGGVQGGREREHNRERQREERRKRRASSLEQKEKKEKIEAEPPAKLLDDLFRKTKTVPCIYWLPLTEEQIAQKLVVQQQADVERERRRMEREQAAEEEHTRTREERIAKENRRDDRRPERKDRTADARQMDTDDVSKKSSGPGGVSGGRGDRMSSRH